MANLRSLLNRPHKILVTLDLGILGERKCEVEYHYSPGRPGKFYMPNGDPGYPPDPAEVEVVNVTVGGDSIATLIGDYLTENDDFLVDVEEQQNEERV